MPAATRSSAGPSTQSRTPSHEASKTEPIFFWRESEAQWGFLSQWHMSSFTFEGHTFTSTEQWMMWRKAVLFGDEGTANAILKTKSPKTQRSLGRQVRNFDGATWDKEKLNIVTQGNRLKFQQATGFPSTPHPAEARGEAGEPLRKLLLATGDRELVEASPYDRIWGIGFPAARAKEMGGREGWGENLLGKALMAVRDELTAEEPKKTG